MPGGRIQGSTALGGGSAGRDDGYYKVKRDLGPGTLFADHRELSVKEGSTLYILMVPSKAPPAS